MTKGEKMEGHQQIYQKIEKLEKRVEELEDHKKDMIEVCAKLLAFFEKAIQNGK
jgi:hypothetical protein